MSLGDEEARALGVETKILRPVLTAAATLVTAAAVSVTGVIGWIGLIVPHVARLVVGPDYRRLLPASMMLGAAISSPSISSPAPSAPSKSPSGSSRPSSAHRSSCGCSPPEAGLRLMLAVEQLAFGYGKRSSAPACPLSIQAGEVLCLLGPNGCGKTTLLKTLLGLVPPLGGRVLLEGIDLSGMARQEIARRIAYVPQAHTTFFPFTVREVAVMGRASRLGAFSSPGPADERAADRAHDALGIGHLAGADYSRSVEASGNSC